jgi:HEPN domain-containing protein
MMKMNSQQTGVVAVETLQWVTWADEDYIAARALLLSGSLVQCSAFSNTAIEKYLKAILTLRGLTIPRTHDVAKLYGQTKTSGGIPPLNEGYLRALVKAYKLRYPDDLDTGFNISLAQFKLLAELDTTVCALRKGFSFRKPDGTSVQTKFDTLLKKGDTRAVDRNVAFMSFDRKALFAEDSDCYELRVISGGKIMEATYRARVNDNRDFEVEALKPATARTVHRP